MNEQILNDRYQLQTRLSKKGARQTYIAKDLKTNQQVIIKVLLFGLGFEWQDHKLFERGAAALKTLSFPGIPQYLDYFDIEIDRHRGFAQVQTYIPAKSLQDHLQAGRTFSEEDIHQLALQLLKILQYLHQRQPAVIHRDIKPSNILLEDRTGNHVGQVYLVDFDSVKTGATRSDYTMTIVGTYGYMPPEQFSGNASPASDLYSLGATLIYAATGKHPADLPQKNMHIEFDAHVSLTQHLIAWLKWMTNPNLGSRLDSATRAIQTLEKSNQETVPLSPQSSSGSSQLPARPTSSRIMVSQTNQVIEIVIPSRGVHPILVILFIFIGAPMSGILMFAVIGILTSGRFLSGLLSLILLLPVILITVVIVTSVARSLFHQVQLRIDQHNITETDKFIGTRHRVDSRADVQIIRNEKISCVFLKTPGKTFALSATTPEELEWLTQLLSHWLQLPIIKDRESES